jgi:hypothetical protein
MAYRIRKYYTEGIERTGNGLYRVEYRKKAADYLQKKSEGESFYIITMIGYLAKRDPDEEIQVNRSAGH